MRNHLDDSCISFAGLALAKEEKKKRKKKDIKKGTPDEPAYTIENYQENVPPPEGVQKVSFIHDKLLF